MFSMRIREVLACPKCGIFSPGVPTTYEANVFYAHMSALQEAREKYPACSFDVALRVSCYLVHIVFESGRQGMRVSHQAFLKTVRLPFVLDFCLCCPLVS